MKYEVHVSVFWGEGLLCREVLGDLICLRGCGVRVRVYMCTFSSDAGVFLASHGLPGKLV